MSNRQDSEQNHGQSSGQQDHERDGYYEDQNRGVSGRDAEFGGNQGMGSYAQSSDYNRALNEENSPPQPDRGNSNQGNQDRYGRESQVNQGQTGQSISIQEDSSLQGSFGPSGSVQSEFGRPQSGESAGEEKTTSESGSPSTEK